MPWQTLRALSRIYVQNVGTAGICMARQGGEWASGETKTAERRFARQHLGIRLGTWMAVEMGSNEESSPGILRPCRHFVMLLEIRDGACFGLGGGKGVGCNGTTECWASLRAEVVKDFVLANSRRYSTVQSICDVSNTMRGDIPTSSGSSSYINPST
jgi:hypothetical protein